MRVEDLLIPANSNKRESAAAEFLNNKTTDEQPAKLKGGFSAAIKTGKDDLRTINVKDPFYAKNEMKDDREKTAKDKLTKMQENGMDGQWQQNQMILAAETMSPEEYENMQKEGFDPKKAKPEEFVTIADKIRLQLAKGGADISMTGDISDAALEEMMGSEAAVAAAKQTIAKAQELPDTLSDDQIAYMMKNDMTPTADNLFKSVYGSAAAPSSAMQENFDTDFAQMLPQVRETIEAAGFEADDVQIDRAKWLISEDIPMTAANLTYLDMVKDAPVDNIKEAVLSDIADALKEGKSPEEATLIRGFSEMDMAREINDIIGSAKADKAVASLAKDGKEITPGTIRDEISTLPSSSGMISDMTKDQISAVRKLEETRLMMSVEANFTLIHKGMEIDTMPLSELVDELRSLEESLGASLIRQSYDDDWVDNDLALEERLALFDDTNTKMSELSEMPAALMGHFADIEQVTVARMHEEGKVLSDTFKNAAERYDIMRTEVRRDLGDSIKKAFRNVDDILDDLDMEASEDNRRAVRILAYNQKEINSESVLEVKNADSVMQKLFKSMTPAVVTELIRKGENPLDTPISDLQKDIDEIKGVAKAGNDSEDFAQFLWKMEQNNEFTKEERDGFIGIYRLMHQVVEADGAPIGALLYQGTEVTMRNLMTAVRSSKHSGREYIADDDTGLQSGFDKNVLSITDQITMAFETRRMDDAKQIVTPEKLAAFGGEDEYLDLSPSQMAAALEEMRDTDADQRDKELERQIAESEISYIQDALKAESRVYDALRRFDIPGTAENLQMMQQMIADRNAMYRNVFGRGNGRSTWGSIEEDARDSIAEGLDSAFDEMLDKLVEDYGEAVKTPAEMAEAERKLEETAENVLRKAMIEDGNVNSIRMRELRQSVDQIRTMNLFSKKEETYAVPIMVADQMGNMSLKIVRGKEEEKGLLDIALDMPNTGALRASMKVNANGVEGEIRTDRADMRERISEQLPLISEELSRALGGGEVTLSVKLEGAVDANEIYSETTEEAAGFEIERNIPEETEAGVQTRRLYGMARSFVKIMGEIL